MSYVFHTTWQLDADPDAVFATLADVASYPSWWPQVRATRELGDGLGEITCRSLLPYDLTFRMQRELEDPVTHTLRARMTGDLSGTSQWTITSDGAGCVAVFDEDVTVGKGLLRAAGLVARPALRFNHDLMMRGGHKGLRAHLASH